MGDSFFPARLSRGQQRSLLVFVSLATVALAGLGFLVGRSDGPSASSEATPLLASQADVQAEVQAGVIVSPSEAGSANEDGAVEEAPLLGSADVPSNEPEPSPATTPETTIPGAGDSDSTDRPRTDPTRESPASSGPDSSSDDDTGDGSSSPTDPEPDPVQPRDCDVGPGSGYDDLTGPTLIADIDDDAEQVWKQQLAMARPSIPATDLPPIDGFEPFGWRHQLVLCDGRLIVTGRWDGDEIVVTSGRRRTATSSPDETDPEYDTSDRPIRVFVYDPGTGSLQPISGIPPVRAYSTAMSYGSTDDSILGVAILSGEQTLAYLSGFGGAAYDLPYTVHLAPIPPG